MEGHDLPQIVMVELEVEVVQQQLELLFVQLLVEMVEQEQLLQLIQLQQ
jgi:hypothetical protein